MSPTAATRENDDSGSKVQPEEVVNMEYHAHVSFLIDKVDTMQKSRLQAVRGPALSIQFWKGQDSFASLLGLDLNQGRPFPL